MAQRRLVIWCPCGHVIEGETEGVLMSKLGAHLYRAHGVPSMDAAMLGMYLVAMVYGDVSNLEFLIVSKEELTKRGEEKR